MTVVERATKEREWEKLQDITLRKRNAIRIEGTQRRREGGSRGMRKQLPIKDGQAAANARDTTGLFGME
jgi:hypothetical protein